MRTSRLEAVARLVLALSLLVALPSCGESAPLLPPDPALSVVVLDPAGRLLAEGVRCGVYLVSEGAAIRLHASGTGGEYRIDDVPPADAQVLVVAHGCPPEQVPLEDGRTYVRLRRGTRVRLHVQELPKRPSNGHLALRLASRLDEVAGVRLPSPARLGVVEAAAFDDDVPVFGAEVPLPSSGTVEVLVPQPGDYAMGWVSVRPGSRGTQSVRPDLRLSAEPERIELTWGKADSKRSPFAVRSGD